MNVVVVGAGIIGASISKHLADKGAKVTVIESAAAPAQGATGKSWAWLNANYKQPKHYRDLNLQSMHLWKQHYGYLCHFPGSLMLHDERPDPQDPLYPIQQVSAEQLQGLEPSLNPALVKTCTNARLFPLEGWCDPVEATQHFLAAAEEKGAQVLFDHKVESITVSNGRATAINCNTPQQQQQQQQQQSSRPADVVVLAAGVGSAALAAQLGHDLLLLHKPAAIVMTRPVQRGLLQHMVITDTVFMLQRDDGRVLIGETHPEEAANTDTSSRNAARILQLAASAVPALESASIEGLYVGYRPYPADGYPVLGWTNNCSNIYIAVTHSGMTLAPLVGQLVAEEVMTALGSGGSSSSEELLAPYRPGRQFAAGSDGTRWAEAMNTNMGIVGPPHAVAAAVSTDVRLGDGTGYTNMANP